jgi:hypothetical protein
MSLALASFNATQSRTSGGVIVENNTFASLLSTKLYNLNSFELHTD